MFFLAKKHPMFAVLLAAAFLSSSLWAPAAVAGAAVRPLTANPLSVNAVFVADASLQPKSSFRSGDVINYRIDATNSSSSTISVMLNFWADTVFQSNGILHQYIILDKTYTLNMPPGLSRFDLGSRIPSGVTTSSNYTLKGTISETANSSDNAFGQSSPFTATQVVSSPLSVPYFSQFADSPRNNECGETSVAMAAAYYVDLHDTAKQWISAVRQTIGVSSSAETDAQQLQAALWNLQGMQIASTPIPNTVSVTNAVQQIQAATKAGYPVIAFVDATKLQPSRPYSGHWFVIVGISGNTVYINDPDNLAPPQGTGQSKTSTISLSSYEAAAKSGVAGFNQPYGLIVTGESFHN